MKTVALLSVVVAMGLAQDAAPPAFEVASVKVADSAGPMPGVRVMKMRGCGKPDPAQVHCTEVTMKMLLARAYDVKSYQIEGPSWINNEAYDVMAKVPEGVPADKIPAMLQALIAERFAAKIHKETRVLPAYELTIAKSGLKVKEVEGDNLPPMPTPGSAPPPPPPRGPGHGPPSLSNMPAGATMMMISMNGSRMLRGNMSMEQLANSLTGLLDRPVFDKTDLKGIYPIELSYLGNENDGIGKMVASLPPPPDGAGHPDGGRAQDENTPIATLPQALQQSVGLKLEPKKAPVEMIVLDSANKVPTEN